jgi:hypothetical protein
MHNMGIQLGKTLLESSHLFRDQGPHCGTPPSSPKSQGKLEVADSTMRFHLENSSKVMGSRCGAAALFVDVTTLG